MRFGTTFGYGDVYGDFLSSVVVQGCSLAKGRSLWECFWYRLGVCALGFISIDYSLDGGWVDRKQRRGGGKSMEN